VATDEGCLGTALSTMLLVQCLMQAAWPDAPSLTTLPGVGAEQARALEGRCGLSVLPQLLEQLAPAGGAQTQRAALAEVLGASGARDALAVAARLPRCSVAWEVRRGGGGGGGAGGAGTAAGASAVEAAARAAGAAGGAEEAAGWAVDVTVRRLSGAAASGGEGSGGGGVSGNAGGGSSAKAAPRAYAPK
jgi:hypothetical protein